MIKKYIPCPEITQVVKRHKEIKSQLFKKIQEDAISGNLDAEKYLAYIYLAKALLYCELSLVSALQILKS